jgi:Glycosyl transferase family 2
MTREVPIPDYVWDVVREAALVDLRRPAQPARLPADPGLPVLICVMRNEGDRVPEFFTHYRRLGVERFIVVDNGSTDGTQEFCLRQPDCETHIVTRKFQWPQKQGWISRLIAQNGYDRWYLYVDTDEHLVFDGAPDRTVGDLARYADSMGITRVRGMMVDMYADGPLVDYTRAPGQRLADAFPLFDSDSYQEFRYQQLISRKGGPRKRVLAGTDASFNPEMSKYPLFRPAAGEIMANPHHVFPYPGNFDTPCLAGLLHYKFLPGFAARIKAAVTSGSYWDDSAEYRRYLAALKENPTLALTYPGTRTCRSPADLVAAGLIAAPDWAAARLAPVPGEALYRRLRTDRLEALT